MALRNRPFSGCGRHLSLSLNQRTVCLDKKNREDIITIIENLSQEKWRALTKNLENITRVEFAKICVGIVQHLTDTTYKKSQSFNSSQKTECFDRATKSSARTSVYPLQSPQGNTAIAEIVLEAKIALSTALENSASGKLSPSGTTEGWSAAFLQLEEETLNILTASLDSSDFFARMTAASCPSGKDEQVDTEGKSDLVESCDKNATESSQQLENVEATTNDVEEPVTSVMEEEVTTVCTNEVISQIFDAYNSVDLEEERLRAAQEKDEEVSLLTSHVVDNVMTQLKELASSGQPGAFHWVQRDVCLPSPWALSATGQRVFSKQFEIAAEEKVSETLMLSKTLTGEAPAGSVPATATEIVGSLVSDLNNLSNSVGSFRSAENGVDTAGTAQNIYQSVQNQIRDFLWGKEPSTDDSVSYDTENSDGTIEEEEEDYKEVTSVENERSNEASSKDEIPLLCGRKDKVSLGDGELDNRIINQISRAPQLAGRAVGYLCKLVCCIPTENQVRDEDLQNVIKAEYSASHISESHLSDIFVIMQREKSSSESSVDSTVGKEEDVEPDPGEASQCLEKTLPSRDRNTTRDFLRKLMCCTTADDQVKAEDLTEAKTSSVHSMSEFQMSDIILIMEREGESPESEAKV